MHITLHCNDVLFRNIFKIFRSLPNPNTLMYSENLKLYITSQSWEFQFYWRLNKQKLQYNGKLYKILDTQRTSVTKTEPNLSAGVILLMILINNLDKQYLIITIIIINFAYTIIIIIFILIIMTISYMSTRLFLQTNLY